MMRQFRSVWVPQHGLALYGGNLSFKLHTIHSLATSHSTCYSPQASSCLDSFSPSISSGGIDHSYTVLVCGPLWPWAWLQLPRRLLLSGELRVAWGPLCLWLASQPTWPPGHRGTLLLIPSTSPPSNASSSEKDAVGKEVQFILQARGKTSVSLQHWPSREVLGPQFQWGIARMGPRQTPVLAASVWEQRGPSGKHGRRQMLLWACFVAAEKNSEWCIDHWIRKGGLILL